LRARQFDGVSVGIFDLDLSAGGTDFDVIAEAQSSLLHGRDARGKIDHVQDDAIPTARLLADSIGQRARTGSAGAAEQQCRVAERQSRELWKVLMLELETEMMRIKRDGSRDVGHLVANPVNVLHELTRRGRRSAG